MSTTIIELTYETAEQLDQPSYITIPLKPHQRMLAHYCLDMEKNGVVVNPYEMLKNSMYNDTCLFAFPKDASVNVKTRFGGICDVVAAGKTLTALTIAGQPISMDINSQDDNLVMSGSMASSRVGLDAIHSRAIQSIKDMNFKMTLIVVPHTLRAQWRHVIKNHTSLTLFEFSGRNTTIVPSDIILMSGCCYEKMMAMYPNLIFNRVFFDEVDTINIPKFKYLVHSLFYWFITASYANIINHDKSNKYVISPIKKIINHTNPDILRHFYIKNNDLVVKQAFQIPDFIKHVIKCKSPIAISILKDTISDAVQKMLYAGDIKSAIETFGIQSSSTTNIVDVVCADIIDTINDLNVKLEAVHQKQYSTEEAKQERIDSLARRIKDKEDTLQNIKNKISESDIDPITYMEIETPVILSCCKTVFDFESITLYITTKGATRCPMCRTDNMKEHMVLMKDDDTEETKKTEEKPKEFLFKVDEFKNLFQKTFTSKSKVIVFSEFNATADIINQMGIKHRQVKGQTSEITRIIDWFREDVDEPRVLFMNAQYKGAGLNLEFCTDVIIYHDMPQMMMMQVIGRAQRVGRKQPLNVYTFDETM